MKAGKGGNLGSSVVFLCKKTFRQDKKIFFHALLGIPFQVLDRLSEIYLTVFVVKAALSGQTAQLLYTVGLFALYRLVSGFVAFYTQGQLSTRNYRLKMRFVADFASKYMGLTYKILESVQGKDRAKRAQNAMAGVDFRDKSAVETFFTQCAALASNLCGLFVYAGMIALLNPMIILLLVCTAGMSYFLQRALVNYDQKDKARYIPLERRLWYVIRQMRDLRVAKDMRLYGIGQWLERLFQRDLIKRMKLHGKRSRLQYAFLVAINVINTLFNGFIYYYLIRRYWAGDIALSDFLLYFGLITGFNTWLMGLADGLEELHRTVLNLQDLWAFHAIADVQKEEETTRLQDPENSIRFVHVRFGYTPDCDIIRDMSFLIRPGEKIALVGLNGAGKTTLVKLLCGLYRPREGRIFLGGRDIQSFEKQELFGRIAAVFQDIYLLPGTVEKNVTLTANPDRKRFWEVVKLAGLEEKIATLPQREQTRLVKEVWEDAVALSGGQMQKLALARALYKGGDLLILDEPTAALDPLAENELYQKYGALTKGKTSVFVSHRLSSTRFCNRIFYMEKGRILEEGNHEQLMEKGGAYAALFAAQSRYYRQEAKEGEAAL